MGPEARKAVAAKWAELYTASGRKPRGKAERAQRAAWGVSQSLRLRREGVPNQLQRRTEDVPGLPND